MKTGFKVLNAGLVASSILLASGCSKEEAPAVVETPKILNLLESSNIPSLVPWAATDNVSFLALGNIMEGLVILGENGSLHPGVAESWDISEDGLVYTFHLRKDAVWVTDKGEEYAPVTAHDFVYSWNKLIDPESGAQYNFMLGSAGVVGGEELKDLGIKAIDDYTFEVTLERPTSFFLSLMSFPIFYPVCEKFVDEITEDKFGTSTDKFLYNGAFYFKEWKFSERHYWEKNPLYWDAENVELDAVDFRIAEGLDNTTAVNMYLNGEIHTVGLSGQNTALYSTRPDVISRNNPSVFYLEINNGKGDMTPVKQLLSNPKARQAIDLVINKAFITDSIFQNGSKPVYYLVPSGFAYYDGIDYADSFTPVHTGQDIETAKQLWEEARAEEGIQDFLEIDLLIFTGDSAMNVGAAIKNDIEANFGNLEVIVTPLPFAEKLVRSNSGNYDMAWSGWNPDYADPMTYLDMWVSGGGQNAVGYSHEDFDALIESAKYGELAAKPAERWEAMLQAQDLLINRDQAIVPLYQQATLSLRSPQVKNYYSQPIGPSVIFKWVDLEE